MGNAWFPANPASDARLANAVARGGAGGRGGGGGGGEGGGVGVREGEGGAVVLQRVVVVLLLRHRLPSFVRGVGVAGLFARSGCCMLGSSPVVVARTPQRGVHGTYFAVGGYGGLHRR